MKSRLNPFLRTSVFATVSFAISASSAQAASATWNSPSSGNWATNSNPPWSTGTAPGATSGTTNADIATFNNIGYQTITLPNNENIGGITFATAGSSANPFLLTGGSLLPSAGAVIQTDSTYLGIAGIGAGITAQGNLTLTANGLAGSGLLTGSITNTAGTTSTITLNGSNSGFNSYYGSIVSGSIGQGAQTTTLTTINSNSATVGSATGLVIGQTIYGNPNIPAGTTITNISGTTITLSANATATVASNGPATSFSTGTLALTKSGTGSWFLSTANTYGGGTNLNGGTLITNSATALSTTGAITVQSNTTLRTVTALTDPSSRISISDGATLTLDTYNVNQTWAGALGNSGASNTAGLTKTGLGTLTLQTATQTYKGDTTINAGQLLIQGNASTNLINASSRLVLGGGQLDYKGTNLTTSTQTFNGTVLNAGISLFVANSGTGTNTVDFGAITRNSGSLLNLTSATGYTLKATGTSNDAGGIVKGLFNGNDFQTVNSGTGVIGTATYAAANNAANTWTGSTTNIQTNAVLTNSTVGTGGTVTLNALKLNGAGTQSFTINGTLVVNDGIIFGSTIAANASEISGGSLTGPSGNTGSSDLIIVNNNAQNTYGRNTISSTIVDNGSATNVILHGAANGTLFISGANTYTGNTYVAGGQNNTAGLVVVGGAAGASIGSSNATVYINGGQGGTNSTLRIGNGDATGDVKGTIQLDNGKLSLNRTDTYTLSASVAGTTGGGYISQDSTGGNATINFAAGNNIFTSLVNAAAGTLNLTGVGSVNAFTSNLNGFNASATTNFNSGTYYFAGTGNAGNQAGTLNINGATVITAGGRYFMSAGGTLTLNSGTFQANGSAMNGQNQAAGNITYNINGGNFITTPNTNNGASASWQLGGATAGATGSVIANQTAGEVSVGLPLNTNTATNQFSALLIGGAGSIQASTYNLSGGVLRVVGGIQEAGTAGAVGAGGSNNFNWTGGRLTTSSINPNFITSNDGVNFGTGTLFQGGSTSIMAPGETYQGILFTGKTSITGNYQIDAGSLAIGLGGTTAAGAFHNTSTGTYDNISVTGSTVLGGRLNVALNNAYTPPNNTTTLYNIVVGSASGVTGTFTNQQTATSGNSRVVLADGLSSFLISNNNTAATATTGGLTSVGARTVALGGYQADNTYSGAGTAWDTASAGAWTNFDAGATATPATQASGAIAQFADGTAATGTIGVSLNSTRNIQGIQFSSAAGSRAYTISQGGSGAVILDNTGNSASATIADTSTSGTANAINVPLTLNSNLTASVTNAANTLSVGGVISGSGKSLTKTGSGKLVITGTNSYSGATLVSAGTLLVNGSLGNTAVTVSSGAILGGTSGTIGTGSASVTVNNGGTLAPGSSPGTLTVAGSVNLTSGSTYAYQFTGGANAATQSDLLNVSGVLTLDTGAILTLQDLGTYTANQKLTLFAYTTLTSGSRFSGYLDDTVYTFGGEQWQINYNDTTAGLNGGAGTAFVTITAVPEPNAAVLLGGCGALALLRRRRR